MRQFTDSEKDDLAAGWRRYKSEYETEPTHIWPFEHGFRCGLDHSAAQLAALTAERDSLRAQVLWLENSIDVFTVANRELTFAFNLAGETCRKLEAERDELREALFRATKDLKRMARDWREYAAGDYCQTYNIGMADGLTRTADQLEDYVNDAWLALNDPANQSTTKCLEGTTGEHE